MKFKTIMDFGVFCTLFAAFTGMIRGPDLLSGYDFSANSPATPAIKPNPAILVDRNESITTLRKKVSKR